MNRRSFIERLAKAAAGFTILPAATTYERVWRPQRKLIVPYWYQTQRYQGGYSVEYISNMNGIWEPLKACLKVIEPVQETDSQRAMFESLFHLKPAPTKLISDLGSFG